MTARAELRARLRALGARPTAAPSAGFVAALGQRLASTAAPDVVLTQRLTRAGARDGLQRLGRVRARPAPTFVAALEDRLQHVDTPGAPVAADRPRHRVLLRASTAAAASVAVVLIATALLGGFGSGKSSSGLQLGAAVNTTVQLPDGRTVSGRSGLSLPDGSIVRTGPDGRASIGSVNLGPGSQAEVSGGQLGPSAPTAPTVIPGAPNVPVTPPPAPAAPVTVPTVLPNLPQLVPSAQP
ncbi:MAG TPA: hypothetical protein VI462_00785, partial [Acidimicrobiia bacterium]